MPAGSLPLLLWLSPAFPVGAFAYSHGLEWAQEAGDVTDRASLQAWLLDLLEHGAARNDAILLACAFRAAADGGNDELAAVAELALALGTGAERRLEATTQGDAFVATVARAWPCPAIDRLRRAWPGPVAYPVALGAAAAGHGIPLRDALPAFGLGFLSNLVSAAVRLGIVGQTDGQRVLAALMPAAEELAAFAAEATLDDLGGAAFRSDLASLRHETQYTRLFRS
jgi:urease accessory protein